ncbi:MAG TPA: hypothetical protein VFH09_02625 [Nitrososphaera sp.]|nr:hypothetical protein [Nitrososphaera sp.]
MQRSAFYWFSTSRAAKHEILAVLALAVLALDYYKRHYQVIVAAINITHPVKHGELSVA